MKKILLLATLFLTCFVMNGQHSLDIENLTYGENAPHEDGYVTFQADWESAGWSFVDEFDMPDGTLADYTDFTLKLASACDFAFQVKVKYYSPGAEDPWTPGQINDFVETENLVAAGEMEKVVSLGFTHSTYGYHGPDKIMAIYIQDRAEYAGYPDPDAKGTVYLSEAFLENNAKSSVVYYGFEVAPVGRTYPSVDIVLTINNELDFENGPITPLGQEESIATVVAEGRNGGNAIEIYMTDHNQALHLPIILPVGTTVENIESVQFDLSMPQAVANSDIYKDLLLSINGRTLNTLGVYGQIAAIGGGWVTNQIRIEPTMFGYEDVKDLNAFDLYVGAKVYDTDKAILVDNVTLVIKGSTDYTRPDVEPDLTVDVAYVDADSGVVIHTIEGGISIESAEGAKTTVYAIDGRAVTSTFDTTIYLQNGMYLVKVGDAPVAKVIVK
jgi:hypothetical protein